MLVLLVSVSAMAIEPSTDIVVVNGKKYYVHTVEKGQTLYSLAKAYAVTVDDIIASNEGLTAETLQLDQKIYVPMVEPTKRELRRSKSKEQPSEPGFKLHNVASGDTLYSIAKRYKVSLKVIEEDNPGVSAMNLAPGMTLRIRESEMGLTTSRQITREIEARTEQKNHEEKTQEGHEVQPGETVYSLSRRYNMSEGEFLSLNNMTSASELKVGMVVCVTRDEPNGHTATRDEQVAVRDVEAIEGALDTVKGRLRDTVAQYNDAYAYIYGDESYDDATTVQPVDVDFICLGRNNTLKAVLMMPFHMNGKINPSFVDFYKGMLLGMEDLKKEGMSIELSVFDTANSAARIKELVAYEDALLNAHIIFGPVYEEELRHVLGHAEDNHIPVVTPFDDVKSIASPVLFQMQPEATFKNDKLVELFAEPREIVFIHAGTNDDAFGEEMRALVSSQNTRHINASLGRELTFRNRNSDGTSGEVINLTTFMRTKSEKTFVILATTDSDIDRILAALSSAKTYNRDRGLTVGDYLVVGNRKWMRKSTLDRQLFFKNDVCFVVSHHAKRGDDVIRLFDARYIKAYHTLPSMFSYRGYEAAMIFCRKMFTGIDGGIYGETFMPLTTPYHFVFEGGVNVNKEWLLEQYSSDFKILAK